MTWRVLAVSVVTGGAMACGDAVSTATPLFSPDDNVERVGSSAVFDTLWVVGGPEDTLLALPALPRPDHAGGLVFFDYTNGKVYRIGSDGKVLWDWGRKGEGPGEIMNVRALDVQGDGTVVLMDSGNRRLVTLDASGQQVGEVSLTGTRTVESMAVLSDGRIALHPGRPLLALWDSSGEVVEVESPAGLGPPLLLHHQGGAVRWKDSFWVFGFMMGNGWMVFDGAQLKDVRPYVVHTEFPEVRYQRQGFRRYWQHVRRPVSSGRSVSVAGDTLAVLFGGGGRWRGWIVDRYDLRTGSYVETDVLPHYANRAVVDASGRVFTVNSSALFPTIVALERRSAGDVIDPLSSLTP